MEQTNYWYVENMVERARRRLDMLEGQVAALWAMIVLLFLVVSIFVLAGCSSGFEAGGGYRIKNLQIKTCEQVRGVAVCSGGVRV